VGWSGSVDFFGWQVVGAKLDRNGLRPLRYTVTHDGLVVAGSETGLVDFEESRIAERQRLGPGEMIIANPTTGTLFRWREILKRLATQQSRRPAPQTRRLGITAAASPHPAVESPKRVAAACGWSDDQYKILFSGLLRGKESDWSMGDDAPPAFLSSQLRTLWDYCKQRFAQVTNPPIDPLRETHVMSLEVCLPQGIALPTPILTQAELEELLEASSPVHREPFSFPAKLGVPGARRAVAQLTTPLSGGVRPGLFLLSDRGLDADHAALPALLATAAFWKRMVEDGFADVPLIVETAQAFDTHHVALLVAAGASAVVPYLAEQFAEAQEPGGMTHVRGAITAGLRKVLARMGVSTLASYRNSYLFEIVGLSEQLCSDFFEDAADFAGQKSLDDLLADYLKMHENAFAATADEMHDAGLYRFRKGAELHANSPEVVRRLHAHVKAPDAKKYSAFEELADAQGQSFCAICWRRWCLTRFPCKKLSRSNLL